MNVYNSKIATLVGKLNKHLPWAITISATSTLYSCPMNEVDILWRRHEINHQNSINDWQVRKGKIWGWVSWMCTYLWRNLTIGYNNNEFEVSANKL